MGSVATQLRQKIDAAKKEQSQVSELERLKNRLAGKETFTVNPANSYAARAAAKTATTKTTAAVDYTSEMNRLENLRRQAAVDLDMTTLNQVNAQMKAMRAAAGKQTVADRASDALSGAFNTATGNYVNAAGTLATNTDYNERQIKRLQESLASGRTSDGKVINDAQRKTIQESIARMQAENRAVAGDPNNAANRMQQTADRLSATGQQQIASAKQGLGKVGQAAVDVGVAGAQLAGDLGLSLLIPGAGTASMAARSFGGAAQEARQAGASTSQQLAYGAGSALVSSLTEKIGNIGAFKRAFGSSALDLSKILSKITQKPAGALAASILSEGGEEFLEAVAQPVLQRLTYDPSAAYDEEWAADALYSAIIGGVLGGVGGSGSVLASGANRIGNTWAQSQNKSPQARQSVSGDSKQTGAQGQTGAAAGQNNNAPEVGADDRYIYQEHHGNILDGVRAHLAEVQSIPPVAQLTGQEFQRTPSDTRNLRTKVIEFFNSMGNKVFRPGFGEIALNDAGARDSLAHGYGKIKAATFAALPEVLQNGKIISYDPNYQGRDYESFLIAAPVRIGTDTGYVGAYVIKDVNTQRYKVHEVLMIDKEGAQSFKTETTEENRQRLRDNAPLAEESANPTSLATNGDAGTQSPSPVEGVHPLNVNPTIPQSADSVNTRQQSYAGVRVFDLIADVTGKTPTWEDVRAYSRAYPDQGAQAAVEVALNQGLLSIGKRGELHITKAGQAARYYDYDADAVKSGDGLGAADAGSLNSSYDNLQAQSSSFYPEGANAARPVDVPTRDFEGQNISKSASTVMGAQAIPDDVIPMIEQMVADGRLSYNRVTDQSAIDRARRSLENKGFAGALERFRNDVTSGKASKDTVVLGQTLLNNAANARDGAAVAEILSLYQSLNTNIGQAMQAASILRKLSPESQLYGVQRSVENMKTALEKQMGGAGTADIKIDDALVQKFLNQTDQAGRDAVMREIYQNVADQVPPNWWDKWNAWRYLSMLGNPRTHIRNVVGNLGFQPVRAIKNEIAAGLETALSALGVDVERTKSFAVSPALYRAAWNDYSNAADVLGGSKYDDVRGEIQSRRRIFRTGALEAARKGNSAALEWEDAIFKRITYADSLAGYLKANGVTAAQMESGQVDADLLSRARDYAAQEALKATYQDNSQLADLASARFQKNTALKRVANAGVDAVLPFRKTPANILSRALEYSPAGLAKSLTVDLRKVQNGDMSVSQALDNVASGLTGTGLFALGAYLFAQGLVAGGQGDSEDDKWAELLGHQGYALELEDGTSITLDWLAPESLPFFMGVEMMSAVGENGWDASSIANSLWEATKSAANPMLELSMMQGVNDLIESVQYAEEKPLMAMIPSVITSYFSQGIPTLLGQVERSGEDVRMTTYTDKNASLNPDVQYALGRASSRLPLWDYNQIPYIDAWGREEETGDLGWRLLNNAANPAYVSQVEVDKVESELQRLRDATGETSVFPDRAARYITDKDGNRKDLTAEEYVKYAKDLGNSSYKLIQEATASREYKAMSDTDKVEYIGDLYAYADAAARAKIGGKPLEGWQLNAQNAKKDLGVSTTEYIALYQKYGSSILSGKAYEKTRQAVKVGLTVGEYAAMKAGLDADGNDSVSQEEAKTYLDKQDFSRSQKDELWNIINASWKKNPYTS